MKKIILFIVLLIIPFSVSANTIDDFNLDVTVLRNGDIRVRENFSLRGEYNGFERILLYSSMDQRTFSADKESLRGSTIYNPSEIVINSVGRDGGFVRGRTADRGYTFEAGSRVRIYNHHSRGEDFYLDYTMKNMAVVHNDIAEFAWQIFSTEMVENIRNFNVEIKFEEEIDFLRGWAHGNVVGEIEILDDTVKITATNINARTPVGFRLVFNEDAISESTKTTGMDALDYIFEIEEEWAEERNQYIRRQVLISTITTYSMIVLIAAFFPLIIYVYKEYDKEYESSFKTDYYRDFPKPYGPEIVSYLMNKKIEANDMSAALMNLIADKKITFEPVGKKDFELTFVGNKEELKESDKMLVEIFFEDISEGTVTMKDINRYTKRSPNKFYNKFNAWKSEVLLEASEYNFYYDTHSHFKFILYTFLTMVTIFLGLAYHVEPVYLVATFISGFIFTIYLIRIKKRTKEGNEDYAKWKGLKKFINDFGNFSERDLPHVTLWEKYLVYALVFKNAKKLAKTMEIKFRNMPENQRISTFDAYYFTRISMMNAAVSTGVNQAVNYSKAKAASAGGTGGGFSSGGGSFGGGGGGGRF